MTDKIEGLGWDLFASLNGKTRTQVRVAIAGSLLPGIAASGMSGGSPAAVVDRAFDIADEFMARADSVADTVTVGEVVGRIRFALDVDTSQFETDLARAAETAKTQVAAIRDAWDSLLGPKP